MIFLISASAPVATPPVWKAVLVRFPVLTLLLFRDNAAGEFSPAVVLTPRDEAEQVRSSPLLQCIFAERVFHLPSFIPRYLLMTCKFGHSFSSVISGCGLSYRRSEAYQVFHFALKCRDRSRPFFVM